MMYRPAQRPSAFRYMCEYMDIDSCIYVYTYVYVQQYVYLYIERYRETFISLSCTHSIILCNHICFPIVFDQLCLL